MSTLGCQTPRIATYPKWKWSAGDDAAFLGESYGLKPDPWQVPIIASWLGENKAGRLVAGKCGLAVPRQNGKNGTVEIVQLYKMVVQGRKILHTAHELKTARKHFKRMLGFFDNAQKYPELAALVEEIRRTNGQEAIVLTNGASLEFIARSKASGRGYTVDDLFFDEAQELTDEDLEALLPTISSAPSGDPQQIYTGTPPGPSAEGEVFTRLRREGVAGTSKRLAWFEWSIPDDLDPAEAVKRWRELAYATNPSLGIRLNITTVEDEVGAMSPDGFCRERHGQWAIEAGATRAFQRSAWNVLIKPKPAEGVKCFGVKFTPDGTTVALGAGIRDDSGLVHVEGIRQENAGEGLGWLTEFLSARFESSSLIVIDGKAGTGALIQGLKDAGVNRRGLVLVPSLDQYAQAHSMLLEAVKSGTVSHRGQSALDDQVFDAVKRPLSKTSGAFGWSASDGGMIPLLDAVTLAFWAAKTTRVNLSASRSDASQRRAANTRRGR